MLCKPIYALTYEIVDLVSEFMVSIEGALSIIGLRLSKTYLKKEINPF